MLLLANKIHNKKVYLVHFNFCNWLSFFLWAIWEADQTSLLNIWGEGKRSSEGNG